LIVLIAVIITTTDSNITNGLLLCLRRLLRLLPDDLTPVMSLT